MNNPEIKQCEFCQQEVLHIGSCVYCYRVNYKIITECLEKQLREKTELERLGQESLTAIENSSQKIRELKNQKAGIIAEWKGKLTNLINSRKASIQQEITLLKEILSHD